MTKPKMVLIDQATLDFYLNECHQMHALCDRAMVPREIEESVLSTAQRVAIMEGVCSKFISDATGVPQATEH